MADSTSDLERGRESCKRLAWAEAYAALSSADRSTALSADDLDLYATSAYMTGRETDYIECLQRAHEAYLERGDGRQAVRCAFWISVNLVRLGETAQAGGWIKRGRRLLEKDGGDCAERGYLLMPGVFELESKGDLKAAASVSGEAAAIGQQFGDADLFALASHTRGHILVRDGQFSEGLDLLDEAMVEVTRGELSPIASGIVYCGVILACREAQEVRRAVEWTRALSDWCDRQPEMVAFTGRCRVHRAEIMQLRGDWDEGVEEARRARDRCLEGGNPGAAGEACYRLAEMHRLRGEFDQAEDAFREASRRGRQPHPGLALLRLAEGRPGDAATAIDRCLAETAEPTRRMTLLPAAIEIALAGGRIEAARAHLDEIELASGSERPAMLEAVVDGSKGAIELAAGEPSAALVGLRRAWEIWEELGAPYEAARIRILIGRSCEELGDGEAAGIELAAAGEVFDELGIRAEYRRLTEDGSAGPERDDYGLTEREREVLRLLAAGDRNREIAEKLVISEHTVARHVQNIFAKLGASSRTEATRTAIDRRLL